jgi:type VI protein secretion system component VasF
VAHRGIYPIGIDGGDAVVVARRTIGIHLEVIARHPEASRDMRPHTRGPVLGRKRRVSTVAIWALLGLGLVKSALLVVVVFAGWL